MEELGIKMPPHDGHHPKLDEETRKQLDDIRAKVEAGELTQEEAQAQLTELGINKPFPFGDRDGMDEETHQKTHDIRDQYAAGMISKEEAQSQLDELGVDMDLDQMPDPFAGLDDETKQKAQAILKEVIAGTLTREEAHTQLEELGVQPPHGGRKGHFKGFGPKQDTTDQGGAATEDTTPEKTSTDNVTL